MFRGMEYIYEVWQEKSFSAAAKKLYISQPALSNSVKRVEERVGTPIFDRSVSPIQLTEVGEKYIDTVEQIMAAKENFARYLADAQELRTGRISIGSGTMMSSYLLPGIVADYKERYPYVTVKIVEGNTVELKKQLTEGMLDLVIENTAFSSSAFKSQLYRRECIVLVVPRSWEINRQLVAWQQSKENIVSGHYLHPRYPAVDLKVFADSPFLLTTPDDGGRQRAISLCERNGFTPRESLSLEQQLTAYNMVCAGMGAAFVSDTLVKGTLSNPNVVYYKLEGPEVERDICFYYKKNRYMPRCLELFLECIKSAPGES